MKMYLQEAGPVLYQNLEKYICDFNNSFVLLEGYTNECLEKIRFYYHELLEDFMLLDDRFKDKDLLSVLKRILHQLLIHGIHEKVFKFYETIHEKSDIFIEYCISECLEITQDDLVIPKSFQKAQDSAIWKLSTIYESHDIYDKMKSIKEAIDLIILAIDEEKSNMFQDKKVKHVTSDELLPIMTFCVINAGIKNIHSTIQYMNDFQIPEISTSELGYALVTFEAAIENIKKEAENRGITSETPIPLKFQRIKTKIVPKIEKQVESKPVVTQQPVKSIQPSGGPVILSRTISLNNSQPTAPISHSLLSLMQSDDEISDPDSE